MKAAKHTVYGAPEVVAVTDIPRPVPSKNEVLIQVMASTVNRTDDGLRSAAYFVSRFFTGLFRPKQTVLGCEFSGIIAETGEGVTKWKTGDQVFGFNDAKMGGHAEYMVLHEDDAMAKKPANLNFFEAAALTEGAHYALVDIYAAGVKKGDQVLVYGASGAIGTAAVQLLKAMDIYVTAVVDGARLDLAKNLGADNVINYQEQDYSALPVQYDFVFDAVGKSSFGVARKVLKPKGIYISTELGKRGENVWRGLLSKFQKGKRVLFPLPFVKNEDIELIGRLASQGRFKPVIDRVYHLDQIVEAYHYVASGKKTGNVVIAIGEKQA
jgi:NADPH:quinone reductase-like Zn-dependent oxidoreductase